MNRIITMTDAQLVALAVRSMANNGPNPGRFRAHFRAWLRNDRPAFVRWFAERTGRVLT